QMVTIGGGPSLLVTNTNDSGPGSLRQAILDSNGTPGLRETISFSIPGTGPFSIAPTSALPTITDPVTIDGTTHPGFDIQPLIELSGLNAGGNADGLFITAGNTVVKGLLIDLFGVTGSGAGGAGIVLQGGGGNTIQTSLILGNRNDGIWMDSGSNRI